MDVLFFDSWASFYRIILITILAYASLIVMLRVSGKRTLSKMNAFDFIVTIALGSTLATVILSKNVALLDGLLGFFMLIFLQYLITWLSVRYKKVKQVITSDPVLLAYKGELLHETLKKERITVEEVFVAVRQRGLLDLGDIHAVVLETTGSINIVPKAKATDKESETEDQSKGAMQDVINYP